MAALPLSHLFNTRKITEDLWVRGNPITGKNRLSAAASAVILAMLTTPAEAAPPPLDAYGNLPEVEQMSLSQSGQMLAIVATTSGERKVIVTDAENRAKLVAKIGDAKFRGMDWAGDDFVVLYTSTTTRLEEGFTTDRTEAWGGTILPANGGPIQRIFSGSSQVVDAIKGRYGLRKVDGEWAGFFAGYKLLRNNGNIHNRLDQHDAVLASTRPFLFKVTLADNKARQVAQSAREDHWRGWLVDETGNVKAYLDYSDLDYSWELFGEGNRSLAKGKVPHGDGKGVGGIGLVAFGPDGKSVIYAADDEERTAHWYEVSLVGGPPKEFLPKEGVNRFYTDPRTGRYVGYRSTDSGELHFVNPAWQKTITKIEKAFPNLNVSFEDWTPDFKTVLVRTDGNKDSGTWYVVDLADHRAAAVGYERPPITPDQVGAISTVEYKAADGLEMDGVLTLPPGKDPRNLPVILLPHGGPHAYDKPEFDWWAQAFASRGYAVFQPNFRGSTNRGQAFIDAGYNQWGRKMQTDISDGLAELARRGIVDPKRACIVGGSYGGYAALAGVTLQQGLYRCAVSVAGVSDLKMMYAADNAAAGYSESNWLELKRFLGDPSTYSDYSPRRHAAEADAPILLIHGKDDTRVDPKQSEVMADALKDAGKPYEFVVLDGEDHFLSRSATRNQMLSDTMAFVQKYNPAE